MTSQETYQANLDAWRRRYGPPQAWMVEPLEAWISQSSPESLAEARRWIDEQVPAEATSVLVIGAGSGDIVEALGSRATEVRTLVLEPEPAVARALFARRDWSGEIGAGRLGVVAGPAYAGGAQVARVHGDLHLAHVVVHPWLQRHRPVDVEQARRALDNLTFQASANESARVASAGRYLLHTLANAPRIAREGDVSALDNAARNQPAVIAAAGPSLDRNIHDLAPVLDRAVVIACDTAALPLLTVGVDADFIVGADPSRANAGHLSALPPSTGWLVGEGSLHPSAFTHFSGRTFVFRVADHEPWPWLQSHGVDRGLLGTWGSVATSAFSLAVRLGCDPIVFIGADFAFTDGRPYCRGTSFEPLWASWRAGGVSEPEIWSALVGRWPEVEAPAENGVSVRTARHLLSFRDWVVDAAATHASRRVINATGAGLLHGAPIAQAGVSSTLADSPTLDRARLRAGIRAAHEGSRGRMDRVLVEAGRMIAGPDPALLDRWLAFGGRAISREAIALALRSPEHDAWTHGMAAALQMKDPV